MERFHNLTELLAIDRAAHAYFDGLPAGIRQQIMARGACLHSPAVVSITVLRQGRGHGVSAEEGRGGKERRSRRRRR